MTEKKVLVYGSLNLDHVYSVDHFAGPGETIPARDMKVSCGGKGLNQAVAFAKAGAQTYLAGKTGSGGDLLRDTCREYGVHTDYLKSCSEPGGHAVIQVDAQGQNGAGKTTTVKLMNGLLRPTKGDVLIEGQSTADKTTATIARKVGYVFQNPDDQIFQESIYKEISYGLVKQKMAPEEVKRRTLEAAALCDLGDSLEEHPYNLPYSKRKFVTIAAIVAMDPDVVILDEPTAGQDRKSTELLGAIGAGLAKKGKIVITITHDMEFVVKYFKRVIVMAEKKKRRDASPREIFWDEELLRFSSLKQPYLCQLANLLGHRDILTIGELLEVTV